MISDRVVRGEPGSAEQEALVEKVLGVAGADARALQPQAPLVEHLVDAAATDQVTASRVQETLAARAAFHLRELTSLAAQLIAHTRLLDQVTLFHRDPTLLPAARHAALQECDRTQLVLQAAATASGVCALLGDLLGGVETLAFVSGHLAASEAQRRSEFHTLRRSTHDVLGEPLWGDKDPDDEGIKSKKDMLAPGSLNALVRRLTSPANYDTKFMKTFIVTYQSFWLALFLLISFFFMNFPLICFLISLSLSLFLSKYSDPWFLLNKLIERYHVPPTHKEQAQTIKLRVCIGN